MAILDGLLDNEQQLAGALRYAAEIVGELTRDPALRDHPLLELMGQGLSIGDLLAIPDEKLDAVFLKASQILESGDIEKARQLFSLLCQLHPLEERYTYGLAATYQLEGNFEAAGRLYVLYLSLDADCAQGRLRLAECFLGAGEHDNAISMFRDVARDTRVRKSAPELHEYARRMVLKCEQLELASRQAGCH